MSPATQPVRTLIPTALGPSISPQVKDHEVKAVHKLQVWMAARMVHARMHHVHYVGFGILHPVSRLTVADRVSQKRVVHWFWTPCTYTQWLHVVSIWCFGMLWMILRAAV